MTGITNHEAADFLQEYAVLLELSGENTFRVRAYTNASRVLEGMEGTVADRIATDTLTDVPGIGQSVADMVSEFARDGCAAAYRELRERIPPGLIEMLRVQGLGPKKIIAVHDKMGIDSMGSLEDACRSGALKELSGFGKKTQENILKSISFLSQIRGLYRLDHASMAGQELCAWLAGHPLAHKVEVTGSLRRRKEIVKDIDIVVSCENPIALGQDFVSHGNCAEIIAQGETKISVRLLNGMQADLRLAKKADFTFVLHHFTGSKEHNVQMRSRAQARGLKLNEYGLYRGNQRLECTDETALFAALDLASIPPELREGLGEITAAEADTLPELITTSDVRGMLHIHSNYSDGEESVADMAAAVRKRGYSYLGLSDHSQSAAYAGGLQVEDVKRQHEEIDNLNATDDCFRIFKGIESDILADGMLDYDNDILERFDFVVVSIHSQFNMKPKEMTARIVRAIEHPASTIVGHLTGRLLLEREGYVVDTDAIIEAAAANDVVIEINANPYRLDMDWRHLRRARDRGVKIAVNTDAHRIGGLDHIGYGIDMARKGWLTANDVINTLETDQIATYFSR